MENESAQVLQGQISALNALMISLLGTLDKKTAAQVAAQLAIQRQSDQARDVENETSLPHKETRDELIGAYLQMLSALSR